MMKKMRGMMVRVLALVCAVTVMSVGQVRAEDSSASAAGDGRIIKPKSPQPETKDQAEEKATSQPAEQDQTPPTEKKAASPPAEKSAVPSSTPAPSTQKLLEMVPKGKSYFLVTIKGGRYDGKTFVGIKNGLTSSAGGNTNDGDGMLEYNNFKLIGTDLTALFRLHWKGDFKNGKQTIRYTADGSKKYGDTGSLYIQDPSKEAKYSSTSITFKEADFSFSGLTDWKLTDSKMFRERTFSGSGTVSETVSKLKPRTDKPVLDNEITDEKVTLEFKFFITASQLVK